MELDRSWDGSPAPADVGGSVTIRLDAARLTWSWELRLGGPPDVPPGPPGFVDGLWEHDVVELFLSDPRGPEDHYVELEVGPAGHWLALELRGVRQRARLLDDASAEVRTSVDGGLWRGELRLRRSVIEGLVGIAPWRGLVTAVLQSAESSDRAHLCWPSLPGDAPDFHQPTSFRLITP